MQSHSFAFSIALIALSTACGTAPSASSSVAADTASLHDSSNDPNDDSHGASCPATPQLQGQLANNPNICATRPHIQIKARGQLGAPVTVTVTGPNSFSQTGTAKTEGACGFAFAFEPAATLALGNYTVTFKGAQASATGTFTVGAACDDTDAND